MQEINKFRRIALAKDVDSEENPGERDLRVALIPDDIKKMCAKEKDIEVFVEEGAGVGLNFSDEDYRRAGATIESHDNIYSNKDLIIKFKGIALEDVSKMRKGSTLLCMAHIASYPKRSLMLKLHKINLIAMEHILESPKYITDEIILSKVAMDRLLKSLDNSFKESDISFLGLSSRVYGAVRRAGNRYTNTLSIYQHDVKVTELDVVNDRSIFFYDTKMNEIDPSLLLFLKEKGARLFDLKEFEEEKGCWAVKDYRSKHPPFKFGIRRIESLHETGMAGCRYGLKLIKENSSSSNMAIDNIEVSVLGYGNVGVGAMDEAYNQGVRKINVLTKINTTSERIEKFISRSNLIINGAELSKEMRGNTFLITAKHISNVIPKGSVVIDLIGGSSENRSAVEPIIECTFMDNPHFIQDDIYISSLWGWPMMGMMMESSVKYSGQILDVLTGRERIIDGTKKMTAGVKIAFIDNNRE